MKMTSSKREEIKEEIIDVFKENIGEENITIVFVETMFKEIISDLKCKPIKL